MRLWQRLAGVPAGRRSSWLVVGAWLALTVTAGPLARVVYARADGLTDADRAKAAADRRVLAELVPGRRVQPPVVSSDGQALLVGLPLDGRDEDAAYQATVRIRQQVTAGAPAPSCWPPAPP